MVEITFGITLGCAAEFEGLSVASGKQTPPRGPDPQGRLPVLLESLLCWVQVSPVLWALGPPGALPPS